MGGDRTKNYKERGKTALKKLETRKKIGRLGSRTNMSDTVLKNRNVARGRLHYRGTDLQ